MSATTYATCCCGGTGLYYALKCVDFYSNYCCLHSCEQSPARINLCPDYLASIGVPVPPTVGMCYIIAYDCCAYYLAGFEDVPCCPAGSPYPCNVGVLVATYPSNNEPCCRPYSTPKLPPGEMGLIACDDCAPQFGGYIIANNNEPCHEYIADCYDLCDQYGLVKGKELTIRSTLSVCNTVLGIAIGERCDHGPPDTLFKVTRKAEQQMGTCVEDCPSYNGVPLVPCTPLPTLCSNEKMQFWFTYQSCDPLDCPSTVAFDCCGGYSPCFTDPLICDSLLDPRTTCEIKTCYAVGDCEGEDDWFHDEEVMTIDIPDCVFIGRGIDPNNQAQLENYIRNTFIVISDRNTTTCWGDIATIRFEICGLDIDIVSGQATTLAYKINYRLGALMQATATSPWADHYWFGTRQPCIPCVEGQTCTRPDYREGDDLLIGTIVYTPANFTVRVQIVGRSKRKHICVAQGMNSEFNCRGFATDTATVTAAVSARGPYPYTLHCLSLPEFDSGLRYDMVNVEEPQTTTVICTGLNTTQVVTACEGTAGYPLYNIYQTIGGVQTLITRGYLDGLCVQMPAPRRNCRCYPFLYEPCPCEAETCPQACIGVFQNADVFCQATASGMPEITWCGQ